MFVNPTKSFPGLFKSLFFNFATAFRILQNSSLSNQLIPISIQKKRHNNRKNTDGRKWFQRNH